MFTYKLTQKHQDIYPQSGQMAVLAATNSKTEITLSGHLFLYYDFAGKSRQSSNFIQIRCWTAE